MVLVLPQVLNRHSLALLALLANSSSRPRLRMFLQVVVERRRRRLRFNRVLCPQIVNFGNSGDSGNSEKFMFIFSYLRLAL
jgi:hypothetical protein